MGLLERISAARTESRMDVDQWVSDYLVPSAFNYGGVNHAYGGYGRPYSSGLVSEISQTLPGYAAAVRGCPPAFAAQMVRALVLSQARFTFRNLPTSRTPRRLFGTRALDILDHPGPSTTTGELLARMEWHAGLAGNAYVYRQRTGASEQLRVLRPDWVGVVLGSDSVPDDDPNAPFALDAKLIGFVYFLGGYGSSQVSTLLPDEVAHWCPLPDPEASHIGMSWITPALREIQGDRAATEHKLNFFRNGATPNMVVKGLTGQNGQPLTRQQFDEIVDMMEARHAGVANAYKTLYLTAGADASVVGANLQQMEFTSVQGRGETRIATLSRVPAPILGISEGLAGSSLNAGNFGMARRIFADSWVYPALQDLAGSLSTIVDVPSDAELWFDVKDIPLLREDAKDAAEITKEQMLAIESGIRGGYTPDSVRDAVSTNDLSKLQHTGLFSVQLQEPGADQKTPPAPSTPAPPAKRARGRRDSFRHLPGRHNQESHGDGAVGDAVSALKDELNLAGRIQLGKGETLAGSGHIAPGNADVGVLWAAIDGPNGRHLRLGVLPSGDEDKWTAANKGATSALSGKAAAELRSQLDDASAKGKRAAKEADAYYDRGEQPPDEYFEAIAVGRVAGDWQDVSYQVWLADSEPMSYLVEVSVTDDEGFDAAQLDPAGVRKLMKLLG